MLRDELLTELGSAFLLRGELHQLAKELRAGRWRPEEVPDLLEQINIRLGDMEDVLFDPTLKAVESFLHRVDLEAFRAEIEEELLESWDSEHPRNWERFRIVVMDGEPCQLCGLPPPTTFDNNLDVVEVINQFELKVASLQEELTAARLLLKKQR